MIPAVVFGLFETGLGVARSLGRRGIPVIGIDYKKDIGCYSRYIESLISPHPLSQEREFLAWISCKFSDESTRLPTFITSDIFLTAFQKNREFLEQFFQFNLPDPLLLRSIQDKYLQVQLAERSGIPVPKTIVAGTGLRIDPDSLSAMDFPVFIKGLEVNHWRNKISSSIKGFPANTPKEALDIIKRIMEQDVAVIIQELIPGEDINHVKYCTYISSSGQILGEFCLRKIRQNPIHFGIGVVVESIYDRKILYQGRKLFSGLGYSGIGSAEFKFDNRDGILKLIEINPRYWQQNFLSTACGINFPYLNYLDLVGERVIHTKPYKTGIKWVNRYMDFDAFMKYKAEGSLSFYAWRQSLRGRKVFSDFIWSDPIPLLYELGFGLKIIKAPFYLMKRKSKAL